MPVTDTILRMDEARTKWLIKQGQGCCECLRAFRSHTEAVLLTSDLLACKESCEQSARAHIWKRPDLHGGEAA